MFEYYASEADRCQLSAAGLEGFDAIWTNRHEWFESPNNRRGGWSGVIRFEHPGIAEPLFIKRQEDHNTRIPPHLLVGIPSYDLEFRNIARLQRLGIPTVELVYFGRRRRGLHLQAILITRELHGFQSLRDWYLAGQTQATRHQMLAATAEFCYNLHAHRLAHRRLQAEHVFVRCTDAGPEIRLIDLETMRFMPFCARRARYDLRNFILYSRFMDEEDRCCFLDSYFGHWPEPERWRKLRERLVALWSHDGGASLRK